MKKRDMIAGLGIGSVITSISAEKFARFGKELSKATVELKLRPKQNPGPLLSAAFNFGIEIGVALSSLRGEWSDPQKKKEWCKHFDVEDWRTVCKHVRTREITKRLAQVHSEDIDKRW